MSTAVASIRFHGLADLSALMRRGLRQRCGVLHAILAKEIVQEGIPRRVMTTGVRSIHCRRNTILGRSSDSGGKTSVALRGVASDGHVVVL